MVVPIPIIAAIYHCPAAGFGETVIELNEREIMKAGIVLLVLLGGLVLVALVVNLALGAKVYLSAARPAAEDDALQANLELFNEAIQKIRTEYVCNWCGPPRPIPR